MNDSSKENTAVTEQGKTASASGLQKVTMNLTPQDLRNAEKLREIMNARSNAQVVSTSMSITSAIADMVQEGGVLMVRDKNGELQRVIIPGFV